MTTWRADDLWDPGNPSNKDRTRQLQTQLRSRLLDWDPIGVGAISEAADEYDCLISPLMHMLHDAKGAGDLAAWLQVELLDHFGLAPQPEREQHLAEDLVAWWRDTTARAID